MLIGDFKIFHDALQYKFYVILSEASLIVWDFGKKLWYRRD
jgi:hypothetical protein